MATQGETDRANAIVRALNRIADSQVKQAIASDKVVELTTRMVELQEQIMANQEEALVALELDEPKEPTAITGPTPIRGQHASKGNAARLPTTREVESVKPDERV